MARRIKTMTTEQRDLFRFLRLVALATACAWVEVCQTGVRDLIDKRDFNVLEPSQQRKINS